MRARPASTHAMADASALPLIVHVVYRFDVGGLENGVINLVNRMSPARFRHAIVALTDVSDVFASRLTRRDRVPIVALGKPAGHGWRVYGSLHRLLRAWQPALVHTRNLAALEMAPIAKAAGVPLVIHGEHGRDVDDPLGMVRKYQWMRRAYRPFVDHFVALSGDLAEYLAQKVGVPATRLSRIINGVDTLRFVPADGQADKLAARVAIGCPFVSSNHFVVGAVGRMQTVKNQPLLARAFVRAVRDEPTLRDRLRLVLVGDGALRAEVQAILRAAGLSELAWLPGERDDVPCVMRAFDAFALPSRAEGISNTVLEAMASGLPVVATDVGGNPELVQHGHTGWLVASDDDVALARTLVAWARDDGLLRQQALAARARAVADFDLDVMVNAYADLYERSLAGRTVSTPLNRLPRPAGHAD